MFESARFHFLRNSLQNERNKCILIYFTKKSQINSSNFSKNPDLYALSTGFNIKDTEVSKVLSQSDSLKSENINFFQDFFKFNDQIDQSYFQFFMKMIDPSDKNILSEQSHISVIPHLYRAIFCFLYQFDSIFSSFLECKDTETIPYLAYQSLAHIAISVFFLPEEDQKPFMELVFELLERVPDRIRENLDLNPNKNFLEASLSISSRIARFILRNPSNTLINSSYLAFVSKMASLLCSPRIIEMIDFQFPRDLLNIAVQLCQSSVISVEDSIKFYQVSQEIIGFVTNTSYNSFENWFQLLELSISITSRLGSEGFFSPEQVSKSVLLSIIWVLSKYYSNEIPDFPKFNPIDNIESYDISSSDLIRINTFQYDPQDFVMPQTEIIKNSSVLMIHLSSIITSLQALIEKNRNFFLQISRLLIAQEQVLPSIRLLYIHLLLNINSDFFYSFLVSVPSIWGFLINGDTFFNSIKEEINDPIALEITILTETLITLTISKSVCASKDFYMSLKPFFIPESPIFIKRICQLLLYSFRLSSIETIKSISSNQIIENLISIDCIYKKQILENCENSKLLLHVRTIIFSLFSKLFSVQEFVHYFFLSEYNITYLMSLSFESQCSKMVFSIMNFSIIHTSQSIFLDHIYKLFLNIISKANRSLYCNIVIGYIGVIQTSFMHSRKDFAKRFSDNGLISLLSSLSQVFSEDEHCRDFSHRIVMSSLNLYFSYGRLSNENLQRLQDPSIQYVSCFSNALQNVKIDDELLTVLASSTFNEVVLFQVSSMKYSIRNISSLRLLFKASQITHNEDILKYILYVLEDSLFNCFHCFQSGFLLDIINETTDFHMSSVFSIIQKIGSSYFGAKELNLLFRQIVKVGSVPVYRFLVSISKMLKNAPKIPLSFGFTVQGSPSPFLNPSFSNLSKFTLSFSFCCLKQEVTDLIAIVSAKEKLIISIGEFIHIAISDIHRTKELGRANKYSLELSKWHNVIVLFSPGLINIKVDKQVNEFKIDSSFQFSSMVSFEVLLPPETNDFSIQSLLISNIESIKGLISEHTVPFPVPFRDVFSLTGGPSVFFPIFEKVNEYKLSPKIIKQLLKIIRHFFKQDEQIFNRDFFRSFNYLLRMINVDNFILDCAEIISDMFLGMQSEKIRIFFFKDIICDFGFWKTFPDDIREHIISFTISEYMCHNFLEFSSTIDFVPLLTRINMTFGPNAGKSNALSGAFNMLFGFASEKLTESDIVYVLAVSFQHSEPNLSYEGLFLLYRLYLIKNDIICNVVSRCHYFFPFFSLLSSQNFKVQQLALFFINSFYRIAPISEKSLINSVMYPYIGSNSEPPNSNQMASLILGYLFGEIKSQKNSDPIYVITNEPHIIKSSLFLPLFGFYFRFCNDETKSSLFEVLFKSIKEHADSRITIIEDQSWFFWISYIGYIHKKFDRVPSMLSFVIQENIQRFQKYDQIEDVFFFILRFCISIGVNSGDLVSHYLAGLLSDVYNPLILKYVFFVVCFRLNCSNSIDSKTTLSLQDMYHCIYSDNIPVYNFLFSTTYEYNPSKVIEFLVNGAITSIVSHQDDIKSNVEITPTMNLSSFYLASILVGVLSFSQPQQAQSYTNHLIKIAERGFKFDIDRKNSLLYLHQLPKLSRECKDQIYNFLTKKLSTKEINSFENLAEAAYNSTQTMINENLLWIQGFIRDRIMSSILSTKHILEIINNVYEDSLYENDLKNRFRKVILMQKKELDQFRRRSEDVWGRTRRLLKENGGIWSMDMKDCYWKLDKALDAYGRRFRLKINRSFTKHEDASIRRDQGSQAVAKSDRKPVFVLSLPSEKDEQKEIVFNSQCQMISVSKTYKGVIQIYKDSIIFESEESTLMFSSKPFKDNRIVEIEMEDLHFALKRSYLHQDCAIEIFSKKNVSYLFVFPEGVRTSFISNLKAFNFYVQKDASSKTLKDFHIVEKWKSGQISNYEYLYWLNIISGRSFNDVTQYPVFPWVLSNYNTSTIDIGDPKNYRDLSKPMGRIDENRYKELCNLYDELCDDFQRSHYRIFYSTPGFVIGYLIRVEPFTTMNIELQGGQFDHAGRLFHSIPNAWWSASSQNGDFRELIPEFFSFDTFLVNHNGFDLGAINPGEPNINDVKLPPWAKNPQNFIHINRSALESSIVSSSLNQWVDLVFGYKQRGENSILSGNDFHPFCYPEILNSPYYDDYQSVITSHVLNFGVIPGQLFTEASPARSIQIIQPVFPMNQTPKILSTNNAISINCSKNKIYTISSKGELIVSALDKQNLKLRRTIRFDDKFVENFNNYSLLANHSKMFPKEKIFVLSSPYSHKFFLFSFDSDNANLICESPRHAGFITSLDAKVQYNTENGNVYNIIICSGSKDSSLYMMTYTMQKQAIVSTKHVSSIVHQFPIIDVSMSIAYDLIVTIDSNSMLVLSSIRTGNPIISRKLNLLPSKVFIENSGNIIIISEIKRDGNIISQFDLYDQKGEKLESKTINSKVLTISSRVYNCYQEYLAISLHDSSITILKGFSFEDVASFSISSPATSLAFGTVSNVLYYCTTKGEVGKLVFH